MPAARARVRRDAPTSDRVGALDALRVVSMAAVVALHASAAYMTVRIPGLIWLVKEPAEQVVKQIRLFYDLKDLIPPTGHVIPWASRAGAVLQPYWAALD